MKKEHCPTRIGINLADRKVQICHACVMFHLLLGENGQRRQEDQTPRSSYSPNGQKTLLCWFFKVVVLPNLVDSHLDFLSSLHCTPPLPSALPALTGQPANRPITAQQKSVSTNRSLCSRSGCTEHTIVLGSGCIPSKGDLFGHRLTTWPRAPEQQVHLDRPQKP